MSKDDLRAKLDEWLKTQGYPLEMQAAQFFHKKGWFFQHSRRYVDPLTEKEREIDLIAFYDDKNKTNPTHIQFVIECKWSPSKPWILFTSPRESLTPYGYIRSIPRTGSADSAISALPAKGFPLLPLFSEVGESYGIVQAFSERTAVDAAYSAIQTAINAADFFARSMSEKARHSIFYVPTVIIDGNLFQCSLDDKSELTMTELDVGFLVYKTAEVHHRSVFIVTKSGMHAFFDRAETTFQSLRNMLNRSRFDEHSA